MVLVIKQYLREIHVLTNMLTRALGNILAGVKKNFVQISICEKNIYMISLTEVCSYDRTIIETIVFFATTSYFLRGLVVFVFHKIFIIISNVA